MSVASAVEPKKPLKQSQSMKKIAIGAKKKPNNQPEIAQIKTNSNLRNQRSKTNAFNTLNLNSDHNSDSLCNL